MRSAQIALILATCSLAAPSAHAAGTVRLQVGQKLHVQKGFSLKKTFFFGTMAEGTTPKVVKQSSNGKTYLLDKPGTYRMTNDAAQARFGFAGKGWHGAKIVVKHTEPGDPKIVK